MAMACRALFRRRRRRLCHPAHVHWERASKPVYTRQAQGNSRPSAPAPAPAPPSTQHPAPSTIRQRHPKAARRRRSSACTSDLRTYSCSHPINTNPRLLVARGVNGSDVHHQPLRRRDISTPVPRCVSPLYKLTAASSTAIEHVPCAREECDSSLRRDDPSRLLRCRPSSRPCSDDRTPLFGQSRAITASAFVVCKWFRSPHIGEQRHVEPISASCPSSQDAVNSLASCMGAILDRLRLLPSSAHQDETRRASSSCVQYILAVAQTPRPRYLYNPVTRR
ncbi:hypothetical protein BS50DRAFT_91482 [Corynespora cassiicola Philippines]|uniref:Uncharacterized protein n=1 Tax=Corynespora cassiicola Philippines TaxID=1448308 RepID=A0A2T2NFQ4_CORCC|nr:hypothetical protein BS50DRAFT_91482 [Corynespora cassiicola Philippines]